MNNNFIPNDAPEGKGIVTAALALAAQGVPVFPCIYAPGDDSRHKKPATMRGFKDASTQPEAINYMFAKPGAGMIGLPTGELTGLAVIDVDTKPGKVGGTWLDVIGHCLPSTYTVRTATGGFHLYFAHPGQRVKNSQGVIAPDVDVRGDGGYVVAAGSPGYEVVDDAPAADLPAWLLSVVCPPEPALRPVVHVSEPITGGGTAWGLAALAGLCDDIRRAMPGTQSHVLNTKSYKAGQRAGSGNLDDGPAIQALIAAGMCMANQAGRAPWTQRDIEATVRRAFDDGKRSPVGAAAREAEGPHPAQALLDRFTARRGECAA